MHTGVLLKWSRLTLEINTTRDIAHQIVRHRSFAFQEFSQRYADPAAMGYPFELRETRMQDPVNRQNSVETSDTILNAQVDTQAEKSYSCS